MSARAELVHDAEVAGELKRAIGLMSGTSMDGIDVALIDTDGEGTVTRGPALTYPYSAPMRETLRKGLADALDIRVRSDRPGRLKLLEQYLTDLHAEVVAQFLEDAQIDPVQVDVIGFHGQTVLHRPEDGLSVQLGDGAKLAHLTGIDVVYDLRAADVAAGGLGAPLAPVYHRGLAAGLPLPVVIVNIGGVANITYVGTRSQSDIIAFDTGPGNALIDDWMRARAGQPCDLNGEVAAKGQVIEAVVHQLLDHIYFAKPIPKALDRNAFSLDPLKGLSVEDGAATLCAFTARSIARSRAFLPAEPQQWVVCGGGRRNTTLMQELAGEVANAVVPAEAVGFGGDSIEAEAWAYMAVRSIKGLPITFPGTTGVSEPMTGGVLARAKS